MMITARRNERRLRAKFLLQFKAQHAAIKFQRAIQVGDKEDSYNTGLKQFLDDKSYKPTYEPFQLGTKK